MRHFVLAAVCSALVLFAGSPSAEATTAQERAFARTIEPLTAADVTANLRGVVGKHVSFICSVVSIVDANTMIGQCGDIAEPYDLYVHLPTTRRVSPGNRLRVLGEMETPGVWVDVTGHSWYTAFVKARYVEWLR